MITIHLIPQAHLDPIWLWPWTAGVDEAVATCRTACDLLDRHTDLTMNIGDAWSIEQVELIDPATFARIKSHVAAGRWDLAGGWYIQPDCNFPLGTSLSRQIEIGMTYLDKRFGVRPRIGMNVDSFGHAAALPTLMRRAGQDRYVMMRPQEHEMKLPARLFNWRDPVTGDTVTTFRIADAYCTPAKIGIDHVRKSTTHLPDGIRHTMCFFGVSDHGGGPTEEMIEWCRAHRDAIDGAVLKFSTPSQFFDAVHGQRDTLPLVEGELQHHAIGCYSVEGRLKRSVRRAEHQLAQAERARKIDTAPPADGEQKLREAWKSVCFQQFHDTIGGTCLPSAYRYVTDDAGGACAEAERQSTYAMRRLMLAKLGEDPLQRIAIFNPSAELFEGYVEFEPWCEFNRWNTNWRLIDDAGNSVPYQCMDGEALADPIDRLLFRVKLEPDEIRAIRIDRSQKNSPPIRATATVSHDRLVVDRGATLHHNGQTVTAFSFAPDELLAVPTLALIEDPSDTWTHRIDRYAAGPGAFAKWLSFGVVDRGPLMCSCVQAGQIGTSDVIAEWRVYADAPFVDLQLRVNWREQHKVLKLVWPARGQIIEHFDGTLGGSTLRYPDGRELPLQDWSLLRTETDVDQAVVCPDTFAADVTTDQIRLTLLRSPVLAHHEPHLGVSPRRHFADRGEHVLRFRFLSERKIDPQRLNGLAIGMHQPPLLADLTLGMPGRRVRGQV